MYFLSLPITTGDLSVWIAQGKYILLHGEILRHDIYSVLPTKPLIYPVGTCVLYALIYSFSGLIGVSLFHKLIILILSHLWLGSLKKLQNPWAKPTLLVIFIAWFGSSMFWIERPALLGMVPLVLSFLILQKNEDLSWKEIIHLNLINIAWVNIHGTWPLLMVMYGWRGFSKKIKWQHAVAILSLLLTSLINPFGYKIYQYVFETAAVSQFRHIDEWAKPNFFGPYASQSLIYFILVFLFFGLVLFLIKQKKIATFKSTITSPFLILLVLGFLNVRNTALAFYVLIPFATNFIWVNEKQVEVKEKKSTVNIVIVGFLLFCTFLFLPMIKPYSQDLLPENKRAVFDSSAPLLARDYLNQTKDSEPLFNDWEYGSFLILEQKHKIFIDTRNIIYGQNEFSEYLTVVEAKNGWENILVKYKIKYVLLNRKLRSKLIENLNATSIWKSVVVDNEIILFKKKD